MFRTPINQWQSQFMKPKTSRSNYVGWTYVTPTERKVNVVPNYVSREDEYEQFKNYVDHVMSAPQGRKRTRKSKKTKGFQPDVVSQPAPEQMPVQEAPQDIPVQEVPQEIPQQDLQPIEQLQPIQAPVMTGPAQETPIETIPEQTLPEIPLQQAEMPPEQEQPQQETPQETQEVPEESQAQEAPAQQPEQVQPQQVPTQGMYDNGDYEYDTYTDSEN